MTSALSLAFDCGEDSLRVRRFSVTEPIGQLFEVSLLARSPREDLDLDAFVGRPAGFAMLGELGAPRAWSGIVSEMEQVQVEPPKGASPGLSTYSIRIVPALWLLGQKRDNRIFQDKSYPDIVKEVLAEYQIEPRTKLADEHPKRDYTVQYGETDFAFVSRLLEVAGVSFWFEQVPGDEGWKSELVLCDRPTSGEPRLPPLAYVDHPNVEAKLDYATGVRLGQGVRPGRFTLRDYDFTKPDFRLVGEAEKQPPEERYEQYRYEHGAFTQPKEGNARADVALAARRNERRKITFRSNAHDLHPGSLVSLFNHPRSDLSLDKQLLVVEATLEGTATGEWSASFEAVFADKPFRPAQRTPWPRISGLQSAIVVGPKGEEIHCDEHGRVKVQFHWDRDGQYDDKSSCWLRVSHGWAGAAFGMFALPRVGQEVLVGFWEGNPDEPLVVGRVHNAKTKSPYKLPDEKTRTTWKSNSSPKSDGFNELMFEDKAGSELVYLRAQRDLQKLVKRNETERTGGSRSISVGGSRSAVIGASDTTLVGSKLSIVMAKPKDLGPDDAAPSAPPTETKIEMIDEKITLTTGKATIELDGDTITLKADGGIRIRAGGEVNIAGGPFVKINC